jgi:hypothetical protein
MSMTEQTESPGRRESLQRVQIGLLGLGAVLLVVAFANIVANNVRPESGSVIALDGQLPVTAAPANGTAADSEPFADLGVTPTSSSVPDLEPDPRLRKPMDQDPTKRQEGAQQR